MQVFIGILDLLYNQFIPIHNITTYFLKSLLMQSLYQLQSLPTNLLPLSLEVNNFYIDLFLNFLLLHVYICVCRLSLHLGFVILLIFGG
jgi:hypothetical protein